MSAFLGPIHHWLFKKILLFEELEKKIIMSLSSAYDKNIIDEISKEMQQQYGAFIPQEPLEALIDTNNIHGWLQERITVVELRQSAVIKAFLSKLGEEALAIIEKEYIHQGKQLGMGLAHSSAVSNAPSIYKEINNYLLEGMPCDNVNNVVSSTEEAIQWKITQCLHKPYWDKAAMDAEIMYNLRFHWIKAFVEAANPRYTYTVDSSNLNGVSLHSIILL
ncbi:hypothetical protein SAMN05660297_03122 [Natronincola peptidivorans]|uniref:Uncharacterized protein n=1 Tax=Natronincola peptidivorans TaxID=426128 RepID=A0A1I0G9Y7_9FIRM|nr:hypothetical protein [Natronincola peptidivorans]SET67848.1 hypothetical protein SAMN05660297_03122 [Natronincola peptidivorans]